MGLGQVADCPLPLGGLSAIHFSSPTRNTKFSDWFSSTVVDRPPQHVSTHFENKLSFSLTKLALIHAMQVFEKNGTIEPSCKGISTPLHSTTIYQINPVIFHPLITLWLVKIEKPYHIPLPWAYPSTSSPSFLIASMFAHFTCGPFYTHLFSRNC
jgi:hypothetical protein